MNTKPIKPAAHGAIDYGLVAVQALAPTLFGLKGRARALSYAFAGAQGLLNAFTDHPVGLKRRVSFRTHGRLETPFVPALLTLPWATGALRERNARRYFASFFAVAALNYLLTDYKAQERRAPDTHRPARPRRRTRSVGSAGSLRSVGSAGSILSVGSAGSILSVGSAGSILSVGSAGSILSVGSAGSILSVGSAGSILSVGSAGSILSVGSAGRISGVGSQ